MRRASTLLGLAASLVAAVGDSSPDRRSAETPKRGGILTYMIPADAPPSFDGHRESTYATIHSAAPFYSTLIRVNPEDPGSEQFVCDLCAEMPTPTDEGKTYTFKLRPGVKFHDGTPLTSADIVASWNTIIFPAEGMISPRQSYFMMVDKVEAPDPETVVFRLKFPTDAFLPALADPFAFIYEKKILDRDPHWYERNVMGSGPFKFAGYETGQSIKGERNPDYFRKDLPYLDGFVGIYAPKQATRVDAIRADRAALEFRGMPPSAAVELQTRTRRQNRRRDQRLECRLVVHAEPSEKTVRRRPRAPCVEPRDRPLARRRGPVEGRGRQDGRYVRVPGIETGADQGAAARDRGLLARHREVAGRGAAAVEGGRGRGDQLRTAEPRCRSAVQIYRELADRPVEQDRAEGDAARRPERAVVRGAAQRQLRCRGRGAGHGIVNPLLDVQKELPASVSAESYGGYEDPKAVEIYDRMLRETDPQQQKALMLAFEKHNLDSEAHQGFLVWWNRIVPYHSYVKGWKIGPSHLANQDLATIWLDK